MEVDCSENEGVVEARSMSKFEEMVAMSNGRSVIRSVVLHVTKNVCTKMVRVWR